MNRSTPLALVLVALASCAAPVGVEERLPVSCSGKCDGLSSIRSLYRDARELDLTDLSSRGTALTTEALNDALSGGRAGVALDSPVAFGPSELAAREDRVEDLDALTSGLLARFGEDELTTVVNEARRAHLESSPDEVFVESGFRVESGLDHGLALDAEGFGDGEARLGLAGALDGRVIRATAWDPSASPEAVLAAVRESRGFVAPRSVDDVRRLAPGEAFALGGEGIIGLNVGAGVPVVVADPGALTYRLVVSAALRAQLEGRIDVQVVRLAGDEVVVDVGTERARVRSARLAVDDGWGVTGLAESVVELGGRQIELGRLLDRALGRQLDERLELVSAELERTGRTSRISVARLRFHLDRADERTDEALSQALRGDLRLAQALAAREEGGVSLDVDLTRSGLSTVSRAGLELFGMRFFASTLREEGTARVETPGGAQELLFDTLRRERGWFFETHGYARTSLAGLRFDADGALAGSEVNLFVEVVEGDEWMQRDTLLDQLDAVIVALAGEDALSAIEVDGNALERRVEERCGGSGPSDPCGLTVLDDPEVVRLRSAALDALDEATLDLDADTRDLVARAGALRLASQATVEPGATFVGPPTSVMLGHRIDDASLEQVIVGRGAERFREAALALLAAAGIDRGATPSRIQSRRVELAERNREALDRLEATFAAHADGYERLAAVERARIDGLGVIGGRAVAVEVPLDGDRVDYDEAAARTVVARRAEAARALFDALMADARAVDGARAELLVGYGLLALVPARAVDARLDVDMDLDDRIGQSYEHYRAAGQEGFDAHARGDQAAPIGGGMFGVDALIDLE